MFTKGLGAAKMIYGFRSPSVQLCHPVLSTGSSKARCVVPCLWGYGFDECKCGPVEKYSHIRTYFLVEMVKKSILHT